MNQAWVDAYGGESRKFREKVQPPAPPPPLKLKRSYTLSSNERKIVEAVESTHPQLSGVILFLLSTALGRGAGVIVVARTGGGKTMVLKALETAVKCKRFDSFGKETDLKRLSNSSSNVVVYDLAVPLRQERQGGLFIVMQLVTDRSYHGPEGDIDNADVCLYIGAVPLSLSQLMAEESYPAQGRDRTARYLHVYYDKPDLLTEGPPKIPKVKFSSEEPSWEVPEIEFAKVVKIFKSQLSTERATFFTKSLLVGHAKLRGDDKVLAADARWAELYAQFIQFERIVASHGLDSDPKLRRQLGRKYTMSEVVVDVLYEISKHGESTFEELADDLQMSAKDVRLVVNKMRSTDTVEYDDNGVRLAGSFLKGVANFYHNISLKSEKEQ